MKKCAGGLAVSQTCSETWALLRTLPLILLVQLKGSMSGMVEDEKFGVLTGLIDLVQMIMSDEFTEESLKDLEEKIDSWLKLYAQAFPAFKLTPKFQNMVHYPSQIRLHGPLKRFAAIRFEAKHQEMKKYMANSKNRMNPTKSMAEAHQMTTALVLSKCRLSPGECEKPSSSCSGDVRHLSVNGWTYNAGDCITVRGEEGEIELFEICELSMGKECAAMNGKKFGSVEYVNSLKAFKVSDECTAVTDSTKIFHYHPLGIYRVGEDVYVIPQVRSQMRSC